MIILILKYNFTIYKRFWITLYVFWIFCGTINIDTRGE